MESRNLATQARRESRFIEVGDAEFQNLWEMNTYDCIEGGRHTKRIFYRQYIGEQCVAVLTWREPMAYNERYRWELEVFTCDDLRLMHKATVLDDAVGNRREMALRLAHRSVFDWMTNTVLDNYIRVQMD